MKLQNYNIDYIKEQFNEFLKRNDCYWIYYENKERSSWHHLKDKNIHNYIYDAFGWETDSQEGSVFWQNMSNLWKSELQKEYKQNNKLIELI